MNAVFSGWGNFVAVIVNLFLLVTLLLVFVEPPNVQNQDKNSAEPLFNVLNNSRYRCSRRVIKVLG